MNPQRMDAERYAHLRDVLDGAERDLGGDVSIMVLPGGGIDRLVERLKCRVCGRMVCPPHDREVRQKHGEPMVKVPFDEDIWTPWFPKRMADAIADELVITV